MSIKDLFYRNKKYKVVTSSSFDDIGNKVESADYVQEYHDERSRFYPTVDFGNPEEFSFYGSAEKYYTDTIQRIYNQYPYDGSLKERLQFINSSSYIDKWFFENEYPRTNGFITLGQNWGNASLGSTDSFDGDANNYGKDTYKVSPKPQYLFFKGGPHAASIRPYDGKSLEVADYKNPLHKANIFDQNRNLESNLQIDGVSGSTVEFWFKAGGAAGHNEKFLGPSPNLAFFDLWNSGSLTAGQDNPATYGRFLIEMRREASELDKLKGDKLFYITIMSGNSGVDRAPIGAGSLTGSYPLDQFNHYAFTFKNNGSTTSDKQLDIKLYINGQLQETVTTGSSINEISAGPHLANLGAYIYAPNTASVSGFTAGGRNQEGIGCVSGSFDEFRFWKERRDSERIFQYYNSHVGGGTNTDPANNHLGVYFKFNEGITATGSTDQTALDYSGRVSNGLIKNYDSTLSMRSTGSAMVQAGAASAEFKDPIIYYYHPEVKSTEEQFVLKGKEYDYDNANMLYYTLPDWISTEDDNIQVIKNLFQVIGAYFDQLHILISDIPRLKDIRYMSGSTDRPLPFANELLESTGFFAPEIFPNATVLNNFLDRDKNGILYDRPLHEVKNFIYENIYHNLSYINKSKGTTKAIRNLIRCFGVDDELFKINFYADNITFKPETSYNFTIVRKNFADFESQARNNAVVFQSTASLNTNSSGYLNHSANDSTGFDSDIGMTFETEVHFGSPPAIDNPNYDSGSFGYLTSSMFGVHTAKTSASDLAWATNDYGNFQVYAVRDELKAPNSKNAYFQIKSTAGGILANNEITSSLFYDVYDNQIWNFAVVVKPAEYPNSTYVSGSTDDYIVEFHGYNMVSDIVANSFMVTASVAGQAGRRFVSSKKRFYVGAHRQDFAGSVIDPSNIKASGCRIWTIPLNKDEIIAHARDTTNYGVHNPYENAFLNENKSTFSGKVPRIKSLALHWDFENVSGSNEHGEFLVEDLSSGSSDQRYGDWSAILEKQHTGQGMFFESNNSGSISREYVATAKTQFFENLNNENFIQVLEKDDEYFGKRARPIRYFFSIEKSMYQSINDEMIDLFGNIAGLQSYASIIGEPVNKYRKQYKKLNFIKNLFFDKVKNTPDLEKYVQFYQWFDDAVSAMILNLVPATSDFAGVQNVFESHILERNKYEHKFPTMDSKLPDISGSIEAINKLKYNWKFGHAPTPPDGGASGGNSHGNQNQNTLWWKQRAERNTDAPNNFGSGDSGVDNTRGFIHSASHQTFSRHQNSPLDFKVLEFRKEGPKNYRAFFPHLQYDSTNSIEIRELGVPAAIAFSGSDDHKELYPPKKFKAALYGNLGTKEGEEIHNHLFPFNMFSSSLDTKVSREFKEGLIITDQHRDTYHTFENEPLQGPFTNTHVGGNQYRHISLNKGEEEKRLSRNRFSKVGRAPSSLSLGIASTATIANTGGPLNNETFTLTDAAGLSVGFVFKTGVTTVDGTKDGDNVIIGVNGAVGTPVTVASRITSAINASAVAIRALETSAGALKLTQLGFGASGNTTIDMSGVTTVTATNFTAITKLDDDEVRPEGWVIKFDNPDATTASLQDAIIIRSGDADTDTVTITMPEGLGNDGGKTIQIKITNLMGATPTANQINVSMGGGNTVNIATAIKDAINGVNDASRVKYGSNISGGTTSGINGLSASTGTTTSRIKLTAGAEGAIGNSVTLAETLTAGGVNTPLAGGSDGNRRLKLVSPDFDGADKPRATYLRDETAKRPVNIRNIYYTTASQELGNFKNNYEVVMTSGRDINNQYFKENLGVSVTGSQSSIISGTVDFTLPDRSIDAYKTKTVIAERFSAPGDPSTLGRGYLDVESESFSAYNNLNYRNLTVRLGLKSMLTASAVHFGLSDSLEPISNDVEQRDSFRRASFHKVNKNSAKRIELKELNADGNPASSILDDDNYQTGSASDNYYVQHQIPQSVMQYSWITASAISGPFGFEKPNAVYASLASDDITFVGESDFGIINQAATTDNVANTGRANQVGFTSNRVSAGATKAKAVMIFAAAATANESITLISSDGTSKTYTAKASSNFASNEFAVGSSATDSAENLKDAINHASGHNGKILAARVGTQVSLVQAEAGERGNTIITEGFGATNSVALGGDGFTGNRFTGGASSILKQPFVPLNIVRHLSETGLRQNTVSFFPNPEFTNANGEDAYNPLGIAAALNSNLLSINGPYGHSSWKQWRTGEHPVSKYQKNNNIVSVSVQEMGFDHNNNPVVAEDKLLFVTEAPLISKFKPLVHNLNLKNGGNISVKHSYSNNLARPANQLVQVTQGPKLPLYDALGINESGPTPPVFKLRGQQVYDDLFEFYKAGKEISDEINPLVMPSEDNPFAKPVRNFIYSETVYPKEKFAHLAISRTRNNYDQTRDQLARNTLSQHRIFWRDAHVDRLRHDNETSLNSMSFKIDKDVTKGWPSRDTSNVSGGILAVDRSNPSPTTTVTASGGSAALSIWPLDTDGEGSAVYAFASSGSDRTGDSRAGGPNYYVGRGAGELSNSTDWTLYYKDYPATASLGYNFVQMLHFSGAYQSNDSGASVGDRNKSPKVPSYQTPQLIGTNPWYDSYQDYSKDIRYLAKDQTILPEFKISEFMEHYLDEGSVTKVAKSFLNLPGGNTFHTGSALAIGSLIQNSFIDTYVESVPLNYYQKFAEEQPASEIPLVPNSFTVSFDGIMKMLPYQGFYPALRTLQLGQMFSQSYGPHMGSEDRNEWPEKSDGIINKATKTAALMQPWFNPGIMFNTIKSGIAVDWPVFKGDQAAIPAATFLTTGLNSAKFRGSGFISGTTDATDTYFGGPNYRFPFESLVEPERFIPVSSSKGVDDAARVAHLAPQWKNFFTLTPQYMETEPGIIVAKEDAGAMTEEAGGGVVNNPTVSIRFRSASPTNGTSIGISTPLGTSITGTVDVGVGTSTSTVIGLSGVSSAADRASRFYDFLKLAISGSTAKRSLHAEYNTGDHTVHLFLPGGSQFNNVDITDADDGLGPATFIDNVIIGPIASSSAGVKFTGGQDANFAFFDWIGDSTPYYRYAMHNFLAEIPNFFLEKQKIGSNLTSFISRPQSKWNNFENGNKYYMDVVLRKNKEMVMFEGPASFMGPGQGSGDVAKTGAARGMHYGPAMRWTNKSGSLGDDFERNLADPAFAAWTPPYFYGTSIARIEFDPSTVIDGPTNPITVEEIFDKSTVTFINLCERHPEFAQLGSEGSNGAIHAGCANTPASASFMHLSSSINLFGKAFPNLIKFNSNKNNVLGLLSSQEQEQGEDPVWVISSKFECPVLNFSGNAGPVRGTSFSNLTAVEKACFDSKGMWYGSGSIPTKFDGIVMALKESFPDETLKPTSTKKSLLQTVGFKQQKKKIGILRENKTISEAIVAIPVDAITGNLFGINSAIYKTILNNINNGDPDLLKEQGKGLDRNIIECSIGDMIRKMSKYVIPPFLDFRNPEIYDVNTGEGALHPFVMYIMEFEHTLDKEDLQNIWQNVMPKIATTAKKANTTISHAVNVPWEFFPNGIPDREMKFIIFKVKQRADNNYFKLTPNFDGENEQGISNFESILDLSKEQNLPYSYNWPYDFFSLVETGKMDCKISFEPIAENEPGTPVGYKLPFKNFEKIKTNSTRAKGDET